MVDSICNAVFRMNSSISSLVTAEILGRAVQRISDTMKRTTASSISVNPDG